MEVDCIGSLKGKIMDMTNKQIRIIRTTTISIPAQTLADVDVLEDKGNGLRSVVASFEMHFDQAFGGPTDPEMLLAIQDRLKGA